MPPLVCILLVISRTTATALTQRGTYHNTWYYRRNRFEFMMYIKSLHLYSWHKNDQFSTEWYFLNFVQNVLVLIESQDMLICICKFDQNTIIEASSWVNNRTITFVPDEDVFLSTLDSNVWKLLINLVLMTTRNLLFSWAVLWLPDIRDGAKLGWF